MEDQFLTIKEVSKSPLKTIAKVNKNKNLDIKELTYELQMIFSNYFIRITNKSCLT